MGQAMLMHACGWRQPQAGKREHTQSGWQQRLMYGMSEAAAATGAAAAAKAAAKAVAKAAEVAAEALQPAGARRREPGATAASGGPVGPEGPEAPVV